MAMITLPDDTTLTRNIKGGRVRFHADKFHSSKFLIRSKQYREFVTFSAKVTIPSNLVNKYTKDSTHYSFQTNPQHQQIKKI